MRLLHFKAILAIAALASGCVAVKPHDTLVGDYLTGNFAARMNDIDAASVYFGKAHADAPQSDEILRQAFFYHVAAGDFAAGKPLAEKIVRRAPEGEGVEGLARLVLAADALKHRQYGKVRTMLSEKVDEAYLLPVRTIISVWATAGEKGPDAALLELSRTGAGEFRGFNPLHQALLGENAGRTDETLAAHQLSIMTYGGPIGREAYGAYLERSGDVEEAQEFYTLLAQEEGAGRRIATAGLDRIARGEATTKFQNTTPAEGAAIGFYSLAAAFLEQSVSQRNAAEEAGFRLRPENYNIPLVFTQIALHLDSDLDVARRFAGSIMRFYGDHEKAIETLSLVAPLSPYYETAQMEIAGSYVNLEREGDAISVLQSVVGKDPDASQARASLAALYSRDDRHKDAIKVLSDVIDKLPDEPNTGAWRYYISRAAAYLEIDEWPRAETDLKRAVEIAPEEPTALNYLGYSWAERGENLEEAFDLIEKAVALQPNSGAIIDSLGWAHYQLGDYVEAVGHLEHAATLEPGDPTITDHLGDVYWRLDRRIEARYQWRRALELDPSEDLEEALRKKIADGLADDAE